MSDQILFADSDRANAFQSQANRAVAALTKQRARAYARSPEHLDMIRPALSRASPDDMITVAIHLLRREKDTPRRWFGFGAEVPALNARAIILLGRVRRRSELRTTAQKQNPDRLAVQMTGFRREPG